MQYAYILNNVVAYHITLYQVILEHSMLCSLIYGNCSYTFQTILVHMCIIIYIYMYFTRGHEELMKNVVNTIKQNIVKIHEISCLRIPQHTLW